MDEEHRVLESMVRDFAEKEIEPINKNIELEKISYSLKERLSSLGFLGAIAPPELGGASLDRLGYSILLKELAAASPSVAYYVFLENSFIIKILENDESLREKIKDVSSGKLSGGFIYPKFANFSNPGDLRIENGYLKGITNGVLNSSADFFIVTLDGENFYLVDHGFKKLDEHERLGLKGLTFSPVEFSVNLNELKRIENVKIDFTRETNLPVGAIALGIASGALRKAIDYAKEREAFLHKLKDFQPLAFGISEAYAELEILNEFFSNLASGEYEEMRDLLFKVHTLDFAKRVTKLALQVHGGYGYLMDFGIEKFYRDAMFIYLLTSHYVKERMRLSELIFETKAGFI